MLNAHLPKILAQVKKNVKYSYFGINPNHLFNIPPQQNQGKEYSILFYWQLYQAK